MTARFIRIEWIVDMIRVLGIRTAKMQHAPRFQDVEETPADLFVTFNVLHHLATDDLVELFAEGLDVIKVMGTKRQLVFGNSEVFIEQFLVPINLAFYLFSDHPVALEIRLIGKHPIAATRVEQHSLLTIRRLSHERRHDLISQSCMQIETREQQPFQLILHEFDPSSHSKKLTL